MGAPYDVLVIGGGVTGTGVARDAALRGLSTILVEKSDFGAGTSGASSWMVHGGVRYLEYDWRTSQLSCQDAGYIHRIAGQLLFRVAFLLPVLKGDRVGIEKLETALEAYDEFQPLKDGHPHVRLSREEALALEPGLSPEVQAALTMDEWGVDPFRLCFLNALGASEAGAVLWNHSRVENLILDGDRVRGARVWRQGKLEEVHARVTCNAAGPWNEKVAGMAGMEVRLRPTKGIHLVFDRRISSLALSAEAVDGRDLLAVPLENLTLVGTTDDDFFGDPDHLEVTVDEVQYILQAFERVLPDIRRYRIIGATAGLRPTLHHWHRYEDDLSRGHRIYEPGRDGGRAGVVTIAGGKLSMFRLMAEQTTDALVRELIRGGGRTESPGACRTHVQTLPGVDAAVGTEVTLEGLARRFGLGRHAASRLIYRHGSRAEHLLVEAGPRAARSLVCQTEPVTEAEVRHAVRHEWVADLDDLRRRTRLAAGPCQGLDCAGRAASILGEERGWSAGQIREELERFRRDGWALRPAALTGASWAQEELNASVSSWGMPVGR